MKKKRARHAIPTKVITNNTRPACDTSSSATAPDDADPDPEAAPLPPDADPDPESAPLPEAAEPPEDATLDATEPDAAEPLDAAHTVAGGNSEKRLKRRDPANGVISGEEVGARFRLCNQRKNHTSFLFLLSKKERKDTNSCRVHFTLPFRGNFSEQAQLEREKVLEEKGQHTQASDIQSTSYQR